MTRDEFIKAYTHSALASWNEDLKRREPPTGPIGTNSNIATFARCIAEAIWELRKELK